MSKKLLLCTLITCQTLSYADITSIDTAQKTIPTVANSKGKYNYYYHGETLRQALIMYAKNANLHIKFSQSLSANKLINTVSGHFSANDSTGLLNTLCKQYGFEWFIYSGTLYITSNTLVNKSVEIAPEDMPMIKSNLKELGLYTSKFGYSELPAENRIIINGPEQYTNMMIEQINSLNIAPTNQQFAVYRLKYANADDTQLYFNGQQITIPGIATILQNIAGIAKSGKSNEKIASDTKTPAKNQMGAEIDLSSTSNESNSTTGTITSPQIQADTRLNAVVVRDKTTNLNIYKSLIQTLDVPTPLIQVEVLIIRLDQDALSQQGINWWATGNGSAYGFGASKLQSNPGNNLSFYYGAVNPSNLLVTNINSFLMSLQFLEQKNMAQAVGKPSIATIDNLPAIVNVSQNLLTNPMANANASGNSQTSASTTSVNTALQITPHVIFDKDNQKRIKLSMVLQDGNLNDMTTGAIFGSSQGNITSQAILNEGQSILLAGYNKDIAQKEINAVPYLGAIPLLGWFFRSETTKIHKLTTLYLVTPKIVWMENNTTLPDSITVNGKKIDIKDNVEIFKNKTN